MLENLLAKGEIERTRMSERWNENEGEITKMREREGQK